MRYRNIGTLTALSTLVCFGITLIGRMLPAVPKPAQGEQTEAQPDAFVAEPIQPLTPPLLDRFKVALGERLFHDPRLSADNSISCASCHSLATGGTDQRQHSVGIYHQTGDRNAPTVFNSSLNYRQFWDGRAASLEAQVEGPLQASKEMGSNWPQALQKLRADANCVSAFQAIYPDGVQRENVQNAIATYERSLVTPNCRFDRFLRGERTAITPREKQGYALFKSYGCISCHQGANVGGNLMQPFGVMVPPSVVRSMALRQNRRYFQLADGATEGDSSEAKFKVPSLRNVAVTAPYFHDGSARTLEDAVRMMGFSQLGRHLSPTEVASLTAFLKTLTGQYNGREL